MSHRNREKEMAANRAADVIRQHVRLVEELPPVGLVLGTGWGDVLTIKSATEIPFGEIPGFERLEALKGHRRSLVHGALGDKQVLCLRGRVHLNEAPDNPELVRMVRLQIEMLLALGVRTLILTSAVGALTRGQRKKSFRVGDVAVVNGFVTVYAPAMPLWGGEFCSPEDTLAPELRTIALTAGVTSGLRVEEGGHVMVRGPQFETRSHDKALLARTGADVVGMSMLPEACVAALYGARVLGLGFVTNDDREAHSHETNLARAKEQSEKLGGLLTEIVARLYEPPST